MENTKKTTDPQQLEQELARSHHMTKMLLALVIGLLIVVLAGCITAVALLMQPKKTPLTTTQPTPTGTTTDTTDETDEPTDTLTEPATSTTFENSIVNSLMTNDTENPTQIKDVGVTWITPEKVGNLKLYAADFEGSGETIPSYDKIATLSDGGSIIISINSNVGLGSYITRFRKDSKGVYYVLDKHSSAIGDLALYIPSIKHDTTTAYNSLLAPDELTVRNIKLRKVSAGFGNASAFYSDIIKNAPSTNKYEIFGTTAYGDLYTATSNVDSAFEDGSYKGRNFILKLADTTTTTYISQRDFLADDGALTATWKSDTSPLKDLKFNAGIIASGCGRTSYDQLFTGNLTNRLTLVGKTASNLGLYEPTKTDDNLIKVAYEGYKVGRLENLMPITEFATKHPVLIWRDGTGMYQFFTNKEFDALAECGKPVVYLYPEQTSQINVQVDADITVSEPTYNHGWTVTATPEGRLTTADGHTYDSLYWEGKGHEYPAFTEGRIVNTADIKNELTHDLTALGLNTKEQSDFLEFWMPRMPKTTFTRLTWFGTQAMNALAPLHVSPAPQTVIRVFLDFEGTESATTTLKSQQLHAIPRTGFTLVEWGGLLRNGRNGR